MLVCFPVVVALAAACESDSGSAASRWAGTVDTIQGIAIVRNPAEPIFPSGEAQLIPLWSLENEVAGSSELMLEAPRDITVAGGQVIVLDGPAGQLHALDAQTGDHLWSAGSPGDGPGELSRPSDLVLHEGVILVSDGGKNTTERFSLSGAHLGSERAESMVFSLRSLGAKGLMVSSFGGNEATNGWFLQGPDGTRVRMEIPAPLGISDEVPERYRQCNTGLAAWSGGLLHSLCVVPHLQIMDLEGTVLREVSIERGVRERTDEELDATMPDLGTAMAGMPDDLIQRMAETVRESNRVRRDFRTASISEPEGWTMLWEQEGADFGVKLATLHLLAPDGRYLARIEPGVSWVGHVLDGDRIYALEQDPVTELVSVRAYRVEMSDRLRGELR